MKRVRWKCCSLPAVDTILRTVKTGRNSDGKMFLSRVEEAIRVRNEERGEKALRPT